MMVRGSILCGRARYQFPLTSCPFYERGRRPLTLATVMARYADITYEIESRWAFTTILACAPHFSSNASSKGGQTARMYKVFGQETSRLDGGQSGLRYQSRDLGLGASLAPRAMIFQKAGTRPSALVVIAVLCDGQTFSVRACQRAV